MRAIGMMSGTSLDGIDLAVVETDGETIQAFGPVVSYSYEAWPAERELIFRAMDEAAGLTDRAARPGVLRDAEETVTRLSSDALLRFVNEHGPADVVGFHGQTVVHRPEIGLTVQLGDGPALAKAAGIPVVYDFRAADMAAGGQGAPLVPVFHRALAALVDRPKPVAVLNLGGVANVTWIGEDGELIACDVGPANALLDDFVRFKTGRPYDEGGVSASRGKIGTMALKRLLSHPFFDLPPPKSLDRNNFRAFAHEAAELDVRSLEDGAALLTAFTAGAVARIVPHLPRPPKTWIVSGGGARNPVMMRFIAENLAPARVETADGVGWSGDHVEAQAFAFLAVRSLKGLPLSFPKTTGVSAPQAGGVVARP